MCDKGLYLNGEICAPCPPGTFSNKVNATECISCAPGDFQDTPRSTQCFPCNFIRLTASSCLKFEYTLIPFFLGLFIASIIVFLLLRRFQAHHISQGLEEPKTNPNDPPSKRALDIIGTIRNHLSNNENITQLLDQASSLIRSTSRPMVASKYDMDEDVRMFLVNTGFSESTLNKKKMTTRARKNTIEDKRFSFSVLSSTHKPSKEDITIRMNTLGTHVFGIRPFDSVQKMLEEAKDFPFHFNVFQFADVTNNHPLVFMGFYLCKHHNILSNFQIKDPVILKFLDEVEISYHDNPYHNHIHATDVLYTTFSLLHVIQSKSALYLNELEYLAIILACAIHDVEHPGVSNTFLIKTKHQLSLLYSDQSVLEYHHLFQGFNIAEMADVKLFQNLSDDAYAEMRALIIDLVLSTDMNRHFDVLNGFKHQVSMNNILSHAIHDDMKRLILKMIVKCADLSNPAKHLPLYLQWCHRVMEEFYLQGDLEKELGLGVSKFMDREASDIAKCQVH